jgi:protein-S-isoprenylcysteine O-methyltransferase Ste14
MDWLPMALFVLLLGLPYGVEQYAYWRYVSRTKAPRRPQRTLTRYRWEYLWDAAFFAVALAAGWRSFLGPEPLQPWEWPGYALFLAGVAGRIWALRELGPFWAGGVVIREAHQVIDTGPYRYVRHPLHWGTTLEIAGLAAFSPGWLAAPALGVSLALTLGLSRREERALRRELGPAYQAYCARTRDPIDLVFGRAHDRE